MQCNYNSFIQIINFHGLFRNALSCRKTGACRILVPLQYFYLNFADWIDPPSFVIPSFTFLINFWTSYREREKCQGLVMSKWKLNLDSIWHSSAWRGQQRKCEQVVCVDGGNIYITLLIINCFLQTCSALPCWNCSDWNMGCRDWQ